MTNAEAVRRFVDDACDESAGACYLCKHCEKKLTALLDARERETVRACAQAAIDQRDAVDKGIADGKWPELPDESPTGMRNGLNAAAHGIRFRWPHHFAARAEEEQE